MNHQERIIVVVDPDEDRATALSMQLDRRGYYVFRRSSGVDALECVAEVRPDLVLSESELLDLGSPELLYSIHEASPATQVFFVERQGESSRLLGERPLLEPESPLEGAEDIALKVDRLLDAGKVLSRPSR